MEYTLTLEYWKDKTWYVGRLKEIPGVFSQGKTLKELKENIKDAYKLMVEETTVLIPRRSIKKTEVGIAI